MKPAAVVSHARGAGRALGWCVTTSTPPTTPHVLAFGGSLRDGSLNHQLVRIAADGARGAGAEVTLVRLRDFPMPIYDGDIEAGSGLPEHAKRLKRLMWSHQGLLISSPEYNSSLPGALKNALDWVSRPGGWDEAPWNGEGAKPEKEPKLSAFAGKVAGIMSASPGVLGGVRALAHLRSILGNMTVLVVPEQHGVARAHEAFLSTGKLVDAAQQMIVERIGATVATTCARLRG